VLKRLRLPLTLAAFVLGLALAHVATAGIVP
jgi:hypothetical protein